MLSHVLMFYQQVFLKTIDNTVDVYKSTLQYMKNTSQKEQNFLTSIKSEEDKETANRLLFFEVSLNKMQSNFFCKIYTKKSLILEGIQR